MPTHMPHILLVEEEPLLAEITQFRLELLGYRVDYVASAEKALTKIQEELPDLILVNQMLSGINGTELLNRLSNDERTSELPAMIISSIADLDDVQKAYNAGADEYLVTPYDPAVLEQKVELLLRSQV